MSSVSSYEQISEQSMRHCIISRNNVLCVARLGGNITLGWKTVQEVINTTGLQFISESVGLKLSFSDMSDNNSEGSEILQHDYPGS